MSSRTDIHAAVVSIATARGATDDERDRIARWCAREGDRIDTLIEDLLLVIRASALLDGDSVD